MAKLSRKITTESNNTQEKNKLSFSLSTKTENTEEKKTPIKNNENKEEKEELFEIPTDDEKLKNIILEKLDLKDKNILNIEQLSNLINKEIKPTQQEINEAIINSIFEKPLLEKIREIIINSNNKTIEFEEKIDDLTAKEKKHEILVKNLTTQVEDAEELTYRTEKKFADAVPINELIKNFISETSRNEDTVKIENLLVDSYKSGGKNGQKFALKFLKGYVWIDEAIQNLTENEKENLDKLNIATKNLLSEISGTNSAERRPLLDIVSTIINKHLQEYDFVSPEQTLQIDPSIHNVEGQGGTSIKEGLSFAVVRRETRKTVFYAEISVK